jgi:hypothetical protein
MSFRNTNTIGYTELAIRRLSQQYLIDAVKKGILLGEIRDEALYLEDGYASFEEYCRKRWDLDPVQVEMQINGARELSKKPLRFKVSEYWECARMLGVPHPIGGWDIEDEAKS